MKRTLLLGSSLVVALAAAGCRDTAIGPPTSPALRPTNISLQSNLQSAIPGGLRLDRSQIAFPSSWRVTDQRLAEAARRAIDPKDYSCPPSTPVVDWFFGKVLEFINGEPELFELLYVRLFADLVPTYEALLFQTAATPQYFGYQGQYTDVMLKTERDVKRFWDIRSDDIQLVGMHGTVLTDVQRTAATYQFLFEVNAQTALAIAGIVRDAVLASNTLNGGNHPLFSFNAFAFSAEGDPNFPIPDKIVMGDGVLEGFGALGFGDVAPQAIYAHEFAHHIQFENKYFDDPVPGATTQAERTRYTELMADALAAYYLTHKRGGTMNRHRVAKFLEAFFQLGDCGFTSPGHHGTPNQRLKAATFGFDVADQAQKKGHILTSEQFHDLFVAHYPTLIAPDADLAAGSTGSTGEGSAIAVTSRSQ